MANKKCKENQRKEIMWNLINSTLAGALVLLGNLMSGGITIGGVATALGAALVIAITKFKTYWETQEKEYQGKVMVLI